MPAAKNWVPNTRSRNSSAIAAAITGTNSAFRIEVRKKPQAVTGIRNQVMPGARSRMTVVM